MRFREDEVVLFDARKRGEKVSAVGFDVCGILFGVLFLDPLDKLVVDDGPCEEGGEGTSARGIEKERREEKDKHDSCSL